MPPGQLFGFAEWRPRGVRGGVSPAYLASFGKAERPLGPRRPYPAPSVRKNHPLLTTEQNAPSQRPDSATVAAKYRMSSMAWSLSLWGASRPPVSSLQR